MSKECICDICNKKYASASSLCNHKKLIHNKIKEVIEIIKCNYCNKEFTRNYNKIRHVKICKNKEEFEKKENLEKLKLEIKLEELKLKNQKIENLQQSLKMHPNTFKKLNKTLINRSLTNSNNINSNNTINIINNNVINNNIISLENERITNTLTLKDKRKIIKSGYCSLEKLVEITNCSGKYHQFKNIIITNMKDNYAYKYDDEKKFFVLCDKENVIEQLLLNRIFNLTEIYNELSTAQNISDGIKNVIKTFLNKLENNKKDFKFDNEDTIYKDYQTAYANKLKILIYNNVDKISYDLALFVN